VLEEDEEVKREWVEEVRVVKRVAEVNEARAVASREEYLKEYARRILMLEQEEEVRRKQQGASRNMEIKKLWSKREAKKKTIMAEFRKKKNDESTREKLYLATVLTGKRRDEMIQGGDPFKIQDSRFKNQDSQNRPHSGLTQTSGVESSLGSLEGFIYLTLTLHVTLTLTLTLIGGFIYDDNESGESLPDSFHGQEQPHDEDFQDLDLDLDLDLEPHRSLVLSSVPEDRQEEEEDPHRSLTMTTVSRAVGSGADEERDLTLHSKSDVSDRELTAAEYRARALKHRADQDQEKKDSYHGFVGGMS